MYFKTIKSNPENYVIIALIIGLILSILLLVWLSLPSSGNRKKAVLANKNLMVAEDSNEFSEVDQNLIKGSFLSAPKADSFVKFRINSENLEEVEIYIPSDFDVTLNFKEIQINTVFLDYFNDRPRFQLKSLSDSDQSEAPKWSSNIKPPLRIRSSQWYLFSEMTAN